MFCHEDLRDAVRYVMRCHVLHAEGSYPVAGSGMESQFASFPRLRRLPDSHISMWWRCIACPQPPALAKAGSPWQPGLFSTGRDSIESQGWVPAFAGTTKGGQRPAQPGCLAHWMDADRRRVHAVVPEGGGRFFPCATSCPTARPRSPLAASPRRRSAGISVNRSAETSFSQSCMLFLNLVSFHLVPCPPPPGSPERRTLIRAYPARAPAPAGACRRRRGSHA